MTRSDDTLPVPVPDPAWGGGSLIVTLAYAALVVFAWGSNYPLMKLALADMPPLTFSATRVVGAAIVVALLVRAKGGTLLPPPGERVRLALIGLLQFASVLGLVSVALQFLPAGRTVTMVYSMPVWAALFSSLMGRGRLAWRQVAGVGLGVVGLGLFLDPAVIDWQGPGVPLGMGLVLSAAVLWGLGAALYGGRQWRASLLSQTFWQLAATACPIVVAALILESGRATHITPTLAIIVVWNWLVPTALAVWAWSRLLNRVPSTVAGQLLAVTPFVGIACSSVLFDERLPPIFSVCAVVIAVGSCLVLWPSRAARRARGDQATPRA